MRTRVVLVAAATLSGLLVAPTSAAGAVETCQGLPATIVASPNTPTSGTEGDDVIVGHEYGLIEALGGNDVICLDTGSVDAGEGGDSILVTGTDLDGSVGAVLGEGDDRYVGGPGHDAVDFDALSPGSDHISTGAGQDLVSSGAPRQPNHDVVDLGADLDSLTLTLPAGSSAQIAGGIGDDVLWFQGDSSSYVFDLVAGVVTQEGVTTTSLPGFEHYTLKLGRHGALRVSGTPGPDDLYVTAEKIDLDLDDGRDRVLVDSRRVTPVAGVIDLGPGYDYLDSRAKQVLVGDLVRERLVLRDSSRRHGTLDLVGVERFFASAERVALRGGREANRLTVYGCHLRLSGGGGADRLAARSSDEPQCGALVSGGPGPDRLLGGLADDRLLGGPGRDEAVGLPGVDTCRAERTSSCER